MDALESTLADALNEYATDRALVVAFSGGLDSTVLLTLVHAWCSARGRALRAIHINHGIQDAADAWQNHCEQVCGRLQVPLVSHRAELGSSASEDDAREARYRCFGAQLQPGECLLLAQHLDDQLETLLLRLCRGAGPEGLAGMPVSRVLGAGILLRPWLNAPRSALQAWAQQQQLHWVEDESNQSTHYDRNYCRQTILPLIEARWPAYRDSWSKSLSLLGESAGLQRDLAMLDLERLRGGHSAIINLEPLLRLDQARQRNVLRYWLLHELGVAGVGWQLLQQLCEEVLSAGSESGALDLPGLQLQVFQSQLFALRHLPEPDNKPTHWNAVHKPRLTLTGNGTLTAQAGDVGKGLGRVHADNLEIRYRQGGESMRLPGRPTKALKKIFQEQGVPPWYRQRIPLLYQDDRLVCVPGIGVELECVAPADEPGLEIAWQHPDFLFSGHG